MKLKLKIRQLRALQESAGISNILKPSAEDVEKMLSLDFLVAFVREGLAYKGEDAPDPEDMELSELMDAFRDWQGAGAGGDTAGNE